MRNRYSKILCLLLLFMCCLPQDGNAIWPFKKKKKEEKKEVLTPYQKLFKNMKVQTAHRCAYAFVEQTCQYEW